MKYIKENISKYASDTGFISSKIMISDDDPGDIYQLNEHETEYSCESKSYKVTINNTEVRDIHSISLRYLVIKNKNKKLIFVQNTENDLFKTPKMICSKHRKLL